MLLSQIIAKGFEYYMSFHSQDSLKNLESTSDLPHIGFFGASNAGKSSLISSLCNQKNLAFSSKTPGKTKEIITFTPKHEFFHKKSFFVDFPGYGYAKASNKTLEQFQVIPTFIENVNLDKSYILIPIEKSFSENDHLMINSLQKKQFCVVLTKCEKSHDNEIVNKKSLIKKELSQYGNFTGQIFITSSKVKKNMQNNIIMQEIFDIFKRHINIV